MVLGRLEFLKGGVAGLSGAGRLLGQLHSLGPALGTLLGRLGLQGRRPSGVA